jgi:outer membrane lipoprotein carrier protein
MPIPRVLSPPDAPAYSRVTRRRWPIFVILVLALTAGRARAYRASAADNCAGAAALAEYVKQFEASYHNVRSLRAAFTQEYTAWNRTRVETGVVFLERGAKMRWEYETPERKLFVSDGKDLLLYVPSEKQLTRTPAKSSDDVRVPLELLVSRLKVRRAFSKIEFAPGATAAQAGDRVLLAYPRKGFEEVYRSVRIELTPDFDIRRLEVTYPDDSVMKFAFDRIARNVPLPPSLFKFTPPAGTEVIEQ